jgi:hypothetical protein
VPATIPRNPETERRARELYVPGVFGMKRVARELGISTSSVRRYVRPDRKQRDLMLSREAKRKRRGVCVDCGAVTLYNGRTVAGPSLRCHSCAAKITGQAKVGTGPVISKALELLEGGPMRWIELQHALGISKGHMAQLSHTMLRHGLVSRPSRGVYVFRESEGAASK